MPRASKEAESSRLLTAKDVPVRDTFSAALVTNVLSFEFFEETAISLL